MVKKIIDENALSTDYANGMGLELICKKYAIGKLRAKEAIRNCGIEVRRPSSYSKKRDFIVSDWKIEKYPEEEGYHYIAVLKDDDSIVLNDVNNRGGFLTSTIKEKYNIEIPSLYDRRIYYQETGNYWWEQWFNIIKVKNGEVKKCPYCGWETVDINNKSGAFEQHLKKEHNKTISEYIKEFPEDKDYFSKYTKKERREKLLENKNNYTVCPICGEKFQKITQSHLLSHNISIEEFKEKYPDCHILSNNMEEQSKSAFKLCNLTISKNRFISKYEREIQEYLSNNNISFETNRQILIGKEIDILIPNKKIGIEFNGLKWHTEWFGKKSHYYYLEKTVKCNEKGYGLIHIFEDEYINHKDIVYSKLGHILGLDYTLPNIMGRKCEIKEIYMHQAKGFLTKYHIQGFVSSTVYLGAYYNNNLVAVMSFKNGSLRNPDWELTRFATDYNYRYQGVGSKLFTYFINHYSPHKIVSFADRRWTISKDHNLYTNLGFSFDSFTSPDYSYYLDESKNGNKYQRIHKMSLSKKNLHKKYGFPLTMTETEMVKELGYDRIWNCGLIKYVWKA